MAGVRTTISGIGSKFPSRTPGDPTGMSLNTFGMDKLHEGINGEHINEILLDAITPAYDQLKEEWPVITGASSDTIRVESGEIGPKMARVHLMIGGTALIEDPRNVSGKDYVPYVEFNGTTKTPPGTLAHAMFANMDEMKEMIRNSVRQYIQDLLV